MLQNLKTYGNNYLWVRDSAKQRRDRSDRKEKTATRPAQLLLFVYSETAKEQISNAVDESLKSLLITLPPPLFAMQYRPILLPDKFPVG